MNKDYTDKILEEVTILEKIEEALKDEFEAYREVTENGPLGKIDCFDDGILEGRVEFAEQIWLILKG